MKLGLVFSKKKHDDRVEIGDKDEINGGEVNGNKVDNNDVVEEKNYQKISKSKKLSKSKKTELGFFILGAKLAFNKLRQSFIKTLILYHFNLEYYIRIGTDASDYTIG